MIAFGFYIKFSPQSKLLVLPVIKYQFQTNGLLQFVSLYVTLLKLVATLWY